MYLRKSFQDLKTDKRLSRFCMYLYTFHKDKKVLQVCFVFFFKINAPNKREEGNILYFQKGEFSVLFFICPYSD